MLASFAWYIACVVWLRKSGVDHCTVGSSIGGNDNFSSINFLSKIRFTILNITSRRTQSDILWLHYLKFRISSIGIPSWINIGCVSFQTCKRILHFVRLGFKEYYIIYQALQKWITELKHPHSLRNTVFSANSRLNVSHSSRRNIFQCKASMLKLNMTGVASSPF